MKHKLERNEECVNDTLHKKIKNPLINMFNALIHLPADLFRSTSTFVLGMLRTRRIKATGS